MKKLILIITAFLAFNLSNAQVPDEFPDGIILGSFASAPTGYKAGQMYYNTAEELLYIYNGSTWATTATAPQPVIVAGATYTLLEADIKEWRPHFFTSENVVVTIPAITYTDLVYVPMKHEGTGNITVQAGAGVTFTDLTFSSAYSFTLESRADDVWAIGTREIESGGNIYTTDGTTGARTVTYDGTLTFQGSSFSTSFLLIPNTQIRATAPSVRLVSGGDSVDVSVTSGVSLTSSNGPPIKLTSPIAGIRFGLPTPPTIGQVLSASSVNGDLEWSDSNITIPNNLELGTDDVLNGTLTAFGDNATTGGKVTVYNGATDDAVIDNYSHETINGNYIIKANGGANGSTTPALSIASSNLTVNLSNSDIAEVYASPKNAVTYEALQDYVASNGGGGTATNANTFSGSLALDNTVSTYYDLYDLSVSGTIDFSVSSSVIMGSAYLPVLSDGVTPFTTKANLDNNFDEQYGIPSDYILSSGRHVLYLLKTPTLGMISIAENTYNPDILAPTVTSATIENITDDKLDVLFAEAVNVTNTTGLSLDGGLAGLTIDSIFGGNGTNNVTFQLSASATDGLTGNFVYSVANTISDLSGNALAVGSTSVTNNVVAPTVLTFTNRVGFTESANVFTKSVSGGYTTAYAVSDQAFTGDFDFSVDVEIADSERSLIGVKDDNVLAPYNNGTNPLDYGFFSDVTSSVGIFNGGTVALSNPQGLSFTAGDKLRLVRTGTTLEAYYNAILMNTWTGVTGTLYMYIGQGAGAGNKVYNPTMN